MKSPTNHTSVAKAEQRGLGTDDGEASHSRPSFMPLQNFCVVVVVVVVAFSLLGSNLRECSTIHSLLAPFWGVGVVEISSRTLIPLLSRNQSTVAQRAETTVAECYLTSCV